MNQTTPPEALRATADLLDKWAASGGKDDVSLNEAMAEICTLHDSLFDAILKKPQFSEVIRIRRKQLRDLIR